MGRNVELQKTFMPHFNEKYCFTVKRIQNSPLSMDSQVLADGRLLDLVDSAWRAEELPLEDIMVPAAELPDPEADNGDSHTTLKEAESKWTDLALSGLNEQHIGSSTAHNAAVYL